MKLHKVCVRHTLTLTGKQRRHILRYANASGFATGSNLSQLKGFVSAIGFDAIRKLLCEIEHPELAFMEKEACEQAT